MPDPIAPSRFVNPVPLDRPAVRIPFGARVAADLVANTPRVIRRTLTAAAADERLKYHKTVLRANGVNDVTQLPMLRIEGAVVARAGLLAALPEILGQDGSPYGEATVFQAVLRPDAMAPAADAVRLRASGGNARILKSRRFAVPPVAQPNFALPRSVTVPSVLPVDVAYWAAKEIVLPDNTTVIFRYPNRWLVILTPKLTIGSNVTFTWEQPSHAAPPTPNEPDARDQAGRSGLHGDNGETGRPGAAGGTGNEGADAPEVEIWTLAMTGSPVFVLNGQDGQRGGNGGRGGRGGRGGNGRNWIPGSWPGTCESGPGSGGDGGRGGIGGDAGRGGKGGDGGKVTLLAPAAVVQAYTAGFVGQFNAGAGGAPGTVGGGGAGGAGGSKGDNRDGIGCPTSSPRSAGSTGTAGPPGHAAQPGESGGVFDPPTEALEISQAQFEAQLLAPAVVRIQPDVGREGDKLKAIGERFQDADVVVVNGADAATNFVSAGELSFTVPATAGGIRPVQVRRQDGTISNKASLMVTPWIEVAEQGQIKSTNPQHRFKPGETLRLYGSGFAAGARIRVNDQEIAASQVKILDSNRLEFPLVRPNSVVRNPSGEQVTVQVVLADGPASNQLAVVLDTFLMIVLGDSIQWGQGLDDATKFHTLVEANLQAAHGNQGFYKRVFARSGAIIGEPTNTTVAVNNGEIPSSNPTLFQQSNAFADDPATVDLILVDGGINDISVNTILNPFAGSTDDLRDAIKAKCGTSMTKLLRHLTDKFPNARIVVTGYFQIISDDSDLLPLTAVLTGLGVVVGGAFVGAAGAHGVLAGGVILAAQKDEIVARCKLLNEQSRAHLAAAVKTVNDELGGPARIAFANPGFGKDNAVLGSDPWLFGLTLDLRPQDPVREAREEACDLHGEGFRCRLASAGHPNEKGAARYASQILGALKTLDASAPAAPPLVTIQPIRAPRLRPVAIG